jgi:hypothetical protein
MTERGDEHGTDREPLRQLNNLMFRIAFARARPCYCYGCICLTPDERRYQRRVFRLAPHDQGRRQAGVGTFVFRHLAQTTKLFAKFPN